MSKTTVLLVGAAGETGGSIANGLLDTGDFVRGQLQTEISQLLTDFALGRHCPGSPNFRPEACHHTPPGSGLPGPEMRLEGPRGTAHRSLGRD